MVDCLMLFECKEFSLAEHLGPGAFTCRRDFGLFQPFNGLDFNSSFHMLTNKCFVKFVAGQKRLKFASCWVSLNVKSISASLSLSAVALPRRPRAYQKSCGLNIELILPSSEVMAINLPAPRGRARLHRTSRLSSRSFRGVRLQSKGCCCLHCWLRSEPRTQRMSLPLPTLRSSSPCASWAAPLSGVCAGSATGFPRTAPTCLRAVGVAALPYPGQRHAVLGARDSSQMLGGLG